MALHGALMGCRCEGWGLIPQESDGIRGHHPNLYLKRFGMRGHHPNLYPKRFGVRGHHLNI